MAVQYYLMQFKQFKIKKALKRIFKLYVVHFKIKKLVEFNN